MATAEAYDEYEDPGLAYSTEDLETWDMQEWAEGRVARLVSARRVQVRRKELPDIKKPSLSYRSIKILRDLTTWYCSALLLPAVSNDDFEAILDPGSTAGKELTRRAVEFEFAPFIDAWEADVMAQLTHVVTIGRRCAGQTKVSGWKKEQKSQSNKLANCLVRELQACRKLREIHDSLPA